MPIEPADAATLARAGALLRAGELVAFPTETVYGLGGNALSADAVGGIYRAKGRPAENPVIVHVLSLDAARPLIAEVPAVAGMLAERFWPGPLTLVMTRSDLVPDIVTAGGPTVAVRAPAHPIARALLSEANVPVAAPSANRSGELSPTTAAHVYASLGDTVSLILEGGACTGGLESTVLDISGPTLKLLRPGLVSVADLEQVVGLIDLTPRRAGPLRSPGLLERHYAPRTPLTVAESPAQFALLLGLYQAAGLKVAQVELRGTPPEVARKLYAQLHWLDGEGHDRLLVELPPNTDDWRAVRDRLIRASTE